MKRFSKCMLTTLLIGSLFLITSCETIDNIISSFKDTGSSVKESVTPISQGYTRPTSYEEAYTYRTDAPYKSIQSLLKTKNVESLRTTNVNDYVNAVIDFINENGKNDFEKAKMVHDVTALLISYDAAGFWSGNIPEQDYANVLKRKTAVCEGYANVFYHFCSKLKLSCVVVHGYARGVGTSLIATENAGNSNHAWNMVKLDGAYYLVDCTWDSGYMDGKVSKQDYNTDWLFIKPEHMIYSRLPDNSKYQLLEKPISKEEFVKLPYWRPKFFEIAESAEINNVQKNNQVGNNFTLKAIAKDGYSLSYSLSEARTGKEISNRIFTKDISEGGETVFTFPSAGAYLINVYYWKNSKAGKGCGQFICTASEGSEVQFPQLYSNDFNVKILSPAEMPLVCGQTYTFKVDGGTAGNILLAVGKQFVPFTKNEDSIWILEYIIPSGTKTVTIDAAKTATARSYSGIAKYTCK